MRSACGAGKFELRRGAAQCGPGVQRAHDPDQRDGKQRGREKGRGKVLFVHHHWIPCMGSTWSGRGSWRDGATTPSDCLRAAFHAGKIARHPYSDAGSARSRARLAVRANSCSAAKTRFANAAHSGGQQAGHRCERSAGMGSGIGAQCSVAHGLHGRLFSGAPRGGRRLTAIPPRRRQACAKPGRQSGKMRRQ